MTPKRSPLAPKSFAKLKPLGGVRLATAACGIKGRSRTDVCILEFAPGTQVAGVLTRSLTASAPVEWCREALRNGRARAIVINSGNANAFTGRAGTVSVKRTAETTARKLGCRPRDVLVASTGVIGERLPESRVIAGLDRMTRKLAPNNWKAAAKAIMTTDTFPKGAAREALIGGKPVTINGIAKGSGMIAPDMGTMLSFVATDAKLPAALLDRLLRRGVEDSFNAITVDGDTSTSDTLILAATGQAKHPRVPPETSLADPLLADFRQALDSLLVELAQQVVRDGEGARKFVIVKVSGATSRKAARLIGLAIANSPLVKTAIAGEDANWGRIVMAVGKSGQKADRDRLGIRIGGIQVAEDGERAAAYDEGPVAAHMKGDRIEIDIDIGIGRGRATVWTCDLTHDYIAINADYRS